MVRKQGGFESDFDAARDHAGPRFLRSGAAEGIGGGLGRASGRASGRAFGLALSLLLTSACLTALLAAGQRSAAAPSSPSGPAAPAAPAADPAPRVEGHLLQDRWVYLSTNFQVAANADRAIGILERAKAAGFNGVLFNDVKFGRLDDGSLIPAYYENLNRVLTRAGELGMRAIPGTADFGYSESILWHDPNLAEGLPVQGERYRARGGRLEIDPEPPPFLRNGSFEQLPPSGDAFPSWAWQDGPGVASFIDRDIKHGGQASLRFENLGTTNGPSGNGRIMQSILLAPYQHYHIRVWVRSEGFAGGDVRVLVLGQRTGRTLQWNSVPVAATQDWTRFDVTFNTLDEESINFYLGVWGGQRGKIWWDDALIEAAGPVNLVRRPGAPLSITSLDGQTQYAEGQDVEPIADPLSGNSPWPGSFDLWHAPPEIRLAEGSRIAEGQRVRLNYYHAISIYGFQVTASLTEPAVFDIVEGQMASLKREFEKAGVFSGWMFNHDEIRVQGWDASPKIGGGTPGEALAHNFRTLRGRARSLDQQAAIYTWSDMFEPFHNAAARSEPYYLVKGDWSGSWSGLAPEVGILNWHHFGNQRRQAAVFFADRGHQQILAGYYDRGSGAFFDRAWLADLAGVAGVRGVMYTQWGSGYDNLEAWAEHVWGDAEWLAPTPRPGEPSLTPTPEPTAVITATPTLTITLQATPASETPGPGTPGAGTPDPETPGPGTPDPDTPTPVGGTPSPPATIETASPTPTRRGGPTPPSPTPSSPEPPRLYLPFLQLPRV